MFSTSSQNCSPVLCTRYFKRQILVILEQNMSQRIIWTTLEVHFMLTIMRDKNILGMLDAKRYRNSSIFQIIEEEMKKREFLKTAVQIRTKWKQLKLNYYKAKRMNMTSGQGRVESEFWEELEELLGHRPAVNIEGGVDTSDAIQESQQEFLDATLDMADTSSFADSPAAIIVVDIHQDAGNGNEGNKTSQFESSAPKKTESHESIAGPSGREQLGPIKKGKTGSYKEALTSFTKDWKKAVEEATKNMIEQQADILKSEFKEQREWEQKLLMEERETCERMMNNVMTDFFANMNRQTMFCPFPNNYVNPYINTSFACDSETNDNQRNKDGDK